MSYQFSAFKERMKGVDEWLKREFTSLRTGQATPALLDGVMVESYGSRVPLSQVGSVTVEGATTLCITPWDASQTKDIERAIIASNLGLTPKVTESVVRISFPPLTGERRTALVKLAKEKLEEAKVSVRKEREKSLKEIDALEEKGDISEDMVKRLRAELQKIVDEQNKKLEEQKDRKEKEIMN